ncbi:hypothetical protein EDC38_0759 [Marinimicrobium koreense]|uniref:Uncharacterized protein n=1 Tax=Marinimicrobium koreense TaxID=306545 RepID=A0A3N1NXM5_9GAMM|nr:hypothetical protein [Marinimicrobium koreense]ROQ20161.1 hypothetical protein EDC38_0759 [Marinimicrobium koreense]
MADEILGVIQALYSHRKLIREAVLHHGGTIPESEETEAAIRALKKHHLVWQMGDTEAITLTRSVVNLLANAQQNRYRRLADGNVDKLWRSIQERVSEHDEVLARGQIQDANRLCEDVAETLYELDHDIEESLRRFSDYIEHGYAHTRDPKLRVKENERALAMAQRLNDSLRGLDVYSVVDQSRLPRHTRHLFVAGFAKSLSRVREEVVATLYRLSELLVRLRADSELGQLIRAFEVHFSHQPDFLPEAPTLVGPLPPRLSLSKPVMRPPGQALSHNIGAMPADVYGVNAEDSFAAIAQAALRKAQRLPGEDLPQGQPVSDARHGTTELDPEHPVVRKARAFVEALKKKNNARLLSVTDIRKPLKVDCDASLWLSTVVNVVQALPEAERVRYRIHFVEHAEPHYSGNHIVEDIGIAYGP